MVKVPKQSSVASPVVVSAYCSDAQRQARKDAGTNSGGGSFDVSLLIIDEGVFDVVATNGDTHLGGEDFDQRVMGDFIKLFKQKTDKDVRKDNRAVQKVRREVKKAKQTTHPRLPQRLA